MTEIYRYNSLITILSASLKQIKDLSLKMKLHKFLLCKEDFDWPYSL